MGCARMTNEELLIKEYVETFDVNTKIDLKFKSISIDFIKIASLQDSIGFYENKFNQSKLILIEHNEYWYKRWMSDAKESKFQIVREKYLEFASWQLNSLTLLEKEKYDSVLITHFSKGGIEYINFENTFERLNYLKSNNDSIIGNIWKCTYKIVNPMLNNARQEITKLYFFNDDNSKIISSIDNKLIYN